MGTERQTEGQTGKHKTIQIDKKINKGTDRRIGMRTYR